MLTKWNYCRNLSHERFTALVKRFSTLTKGVETESYDVKGNPTIELLLLLKYVYCKIILNNEQLVAGQPFLTVEEIISCKKYPIAVKRQVLTDGIIMDENNNLTISYENFIKCLRILDDFQIVARYADLVYTGGINNYIQNYDKYITKSFCQNVEKISSLHIWQRLDVTAYECPIIFYQNNNLIKDNSWAAENLFERFDKIIDWLLERCKHIETFEIGVFAAVTQALYVTEGFDAFTKFVTYAESLDDENRVNLVNKLIAYYNIITKKSETIHKLVGDKVVHTTVLEFIPNIIKSFNLCETIHAYPESMTASIIEANNKNNNLYNSFIDIAKKYTYFIRAINGYKSKPENFVKINEFNRDKTIPMQTIINEYYKFQHYKHKKIILKIFCF